MLGISLPSAQEFADVDIGPLAARWDIGFVPDKHVPGGGIAPEKPSVSVRATVERSLLTKSGLHSCSSSCLNRRSLNNRFGFLDPHPPGSRSQSCMIAHSAWRKDLLDPSQERLRWKRLRQVRLSGTIKFDDPVGAARYHQNFRACRLCLFGEIDARAVRQHNICRQQVGNMLLEKTGGLRNSSDGGCAMACSLEQPDKLMAKLSLTVDDQDTCHVKPTFAPLDGSKTVATVPLACLCRMTLQMRDADAGWSFADILPARCDTAAVPTLCYMFPLISGCLGGHAV